jgi:hypothetical protein
MKSAASSEALNYFEEDLAIYRSKFGEKVSPEKIAMLEKNIAYALLNKGEEVKAANYLTRVLEYHGEVFPKTAVGIALRCVNGFLQLLIGIYLPQLKWKRIPDEKDKEIIELQNTKAKALGTAVPKRSMIETFFMLPRFTAVDISKIEKGFGKNGAKNYEIVADRKEAIRKALSLSRKGDYVLVAGKGHEDYQIFSDKTIPFNDIEVIKALVEEMGRT